MTKRALAVCLVLTAAMGMLVRCGGSSSRNSTPQRGTLYALLTDQPLCDVLSIRAEASTFNVAPANGGNAALLLPANSFIKLDFSSLRDFRTFLNAGTSLNAETYNKAVVQLSTPQVWLYNAALNPPVESAATTLSHSQVVVDIQPALSVLPVTSTQNQVTVVQIDFDAPRSIILQTGANGTTAATFNPRFTVTPLALSANHTFGNLDGLLGFVTRVDPISSNINFAGDIVLQLLSGSAGSPSVVVNIPKDAENNPVPVCAPSTSSNQACTAQPLNQLLTATVAEVDAYLDAGGHLIANTFRDQSGSTFAAIELEDQADLANNKAAFIGPILSVNKDPNGNVTSFTLFVRDEEPDTINATTAVSYPSANPVQVNLTPSTIYQVSSRLTNLSFGNPAVTPASFAPGQEVVVHGSYIVPSAQPPAAILTAEKVYLKLQTHEGTFTSLLQPVGSDDKTGAFTLAPCTSLFASAPIYVFTNGQTNFLNVAGLTGLTPQSTLLVKGLLYYEPSGITINGITAPAGSLVLLARQVHALQ